jgi:cobalamin synthase
MEGGAFGVLAAVVTMVAWFAILFTGEHPKGLWDLVAYYLRWRVRAIAYTALLRDEYPPFGEGQYAVTVEIPQPEMPRDRLTVAFRLVLSIPHLIIIWALGLAWGLTTVVAWFAILLTGRYPAALYDFAVGVLRWTTRVEAYLLLLDDDYPPFSLL